MSRVSPSARTSPSCSIRPRRSAAARSWHVHPYDEIFIIREGRALFTVGETRIEAEAGQIVFGPANVPHKFHNVGPGRLDTTDIHVSDRWIQTDLDDPEASS